MSKHGDNFQQEWHMGVYVLKGFHCQTLGSGGGIRLCCSESPPGGTVVQHAWVVSGAPRGAAHRAESGRWRAAGHHSGPGPCTPILSP